MKYELQVQNSSFALDISTIEYKRFSQAMDMGIVEGKSFIFKIFNIARKSFLEVIHHKIEAFKNAYKLVKKIVKIIIGKEKNPIPEIFQEFKESSKKEKMSKVIKLLLLIGVVLLSGGGLDFEGGIPDLDLNLGIQYHRNLVSHTIIGGLLTEFIFRFALNTAKEFKFLTDKKAIKSILEKIENNKDIFINGMWLGLFIHLFQDASVFQKRLKPYVWIKGHSMNFHRMLFLSNALLSAVFALGRSKGKEGVELV